MFHCPNKYPVFLPSNELIWRIRGKDGYDDIHPSIHPSGWEKFHDRKGKETNIVKKSINLANVSPHLHFLSQVFSNDGDGVERDP